MNLLKFIFSKRFLKNLLIAGVFLVVIPIVAYFWLQSYTAHGDHVVVPDVRGLVVSEAADILAEFELGYLIIDSVYSSEGKPGAVFEQSPLPQAEVKEQRAIYLTVYRITPPAETLKVAEGMNERVAEIILENKGLRYKKEYEENHLLAGMVVRVIHKGQKLGPDAQIKKGKEVTLIIGRQSDEEVSVPSLVGLPLEQAENILREARLTLGSTLYDSNVLTSEDSLAASIYRQSPRASGNQSVQVGSLVDLFLGLKQPEMADSLQKQMPESPNNP
ncbi:MAG: PASTA domain-containing protein [Flavobacteriales bacterium]|nr:PASTA domain-containing protein [Flavobacteriales bacterium]